MTPQAMIAMLAWPVIALLFFFSMRPHRAAIATTLVGWLFLPVASIPLPGLPDYSKPSAISLMLLVGVVCWASDRLASLRWNWVDAFAILLCTSPIASSVTNGLGVYDGIAESISWALMWVGPYLAGRVFFRSGQEVRDLALGIVLGGLVYVPLCLYEARMSPQLHTMVYGYFPHVFAQTYRFGGWRPNVFMNHGLMAGLWSAGSAMVALLLWRGRAMPALFGVSAPWVVGILLLTAILSRSAGALVVVAAVCGLVAIARVTKISAWITSLWILVTGYLTYRLLGGSAGWLVNFAELIPVVSQRSDSLDFRIETEYLVVQHALERPLFGWGGWGRHGLRNDYGELTTISDSLWILTLGQKGVVGLVALYGMLLGPVAIGFRLLVRRGQWAPQNTTLLALTCLLAVFVLDSLLNAMPSPIYPVIAGCIVSVRSSVRQTRPVIRRSSRYSSQPVGAA